MPGENEGMKTEVFDDAINNINRKLEEKFKATDDKLERFTSEIASEIRASKAVENPPARKKWLDEDEDEDTFVTKSDLRSVLRDVVSEVKGEVKDAASSIFEEKTNRMAKDMKVFVDFPQADKKSKLYNSRFENEMNREIQQRVQSGRSPHDADLIYDSAASVYARAVREGWVVPQHFAARSNENHNAGEDRFDMNGSGRPPRNEGPTASQIALARKMGMSEERFRQILENKKKI